MYKIPEAFKAGFGRLRKVTRLPKAPQRSHGQPGVLTLDPLDAGQVPRLAPASGGPPATPFAALPVSREASLGRSGQGRGWGLSRERFSMRWGRSRGSQRAQPTQGLPPSAEPASHSAGGAPSPGELRRGSAPAEIQDLEGPRVSRLSRLSETGGFAPQQPAARPHPQTGALMKTSQYRGPGGAAARWVTFLMHPSAADRGHVVMLLLVRWPCALHAVPCCKALPYGASPLHRHQDQLQRPGVHWGSCLVLLIQYWPESMLA